MSSMRASLTVLRFSRRESKILFLKLIKNDDLIYFGRLTRRASYLVNWHCCTTLLELHQSHQLLIPSASPLIGKHSTRL